MKISKVQAYSLLSRLSCSGLAETLKDIKIKMPEYFSEAEKFLNLYDRYHDRKNFKHGNGYTDVKTFKRAFSEYKRGGG